MIHTLLTFLLAVPPPALAPLQEAGGSNFATRFVGDEALVTTEASDETLDRARQIAYRMALSSAAQTRHSSIRYVSFLHMDESSVRGASDLLLRADAEISLGQWTVDSETLEGGVARVRGTLRVPREQIDPTWKTAQLVAELAGEELSRELWGFVNDASARDDAGAMEHGLRVLLQETPPDARTVSELVSVHERLGEWNEAYLVINTWLDRVPEADRPALQRLLDRGQAEDDDLRLRLLDWDKYLELDGIRVLRLAGLAEAKWDLDEEFERDLVKCFDARDRPWIVTYRHRRTGLEFSLVPANQGEGAALPALVARTECSQEAFARGLGSALPEGGIQPQVRVSAHDALAWCEDLGFELPRLAAWRYYSEAGGFSPGQAAADGGLRPAEVRAGVDNAFGLQATVGNVWEWCRPERAEAPRWPLAGGSHRDSAAATSRALREETPQLKRPDVGFRPIRVLD